MDPGQKDPTLLTPQRLTWDVGGLSGRGPGSGSWRGSYEIDVDREEVAAPATGVGDGVCVHSEAWGRSPASCMTPRPGHGGHLGDDPGQPATGGAVGPGEVGEDPGEPLSSHAGPTEIAATGKGRLNRRCRMSASLQMGRDAQRGLDPAQQGGAANHRACPADYRNGGHRRSNGGIPSRGSRHAGEGDMPLVTSRPLSYVVAG
jgi:hypothetical protein